MKTHIVKLVERQIPGEVPIFLLYGPPGTSKTTMAKSLANEKKWDVISISPSDFVSDSLDKVEFRSREIFRDLMMVDKAVVIFDEIDSLLRDRDIFRDKPGTIIEFVVPALLPKLQEFHDYVETKDIAVFFLTNYFESVDSAIRRAGRIDAHLPILPYARLALGKVLEKQRAEYAKKGMTISSDKWDGLLSVLKQAPCHFVFQDVKAIIRETAKPNLSNADRFAHNERAAWLHLRATTTIESTGVLKS